MTPAVALSRHRLPERALALDHGNSPFLDLEELMAPLPLMSLDRMLLLFHFRPKSLNMYLAPHVPYA